MSICYLEITTWQGISLGAQHFYGELRTSDDYNDSAKLERKLTPRAAAAMNKSRRNMGLMELHYRAGQMFNGFDTREEIIALAVKTYREHFSKTTILVLGDRAVAEPCPVLDGPDGVKVTAQKLYDENEKIHAQSWWDKRKNRKRMDELCKEWDRLMEAHK